MLHPRGVTTQIRKLPRDGASYRCIELTEQCTFFISFPGSEHYILDTKNNGHVCGNCKNKVHGTLNNTTKGWFWDPSECSHVCNYMNVQSIEYYQGLAFGFQHSRPGIL